MLFSSDQPDKTGPIVAALLQKELGLNTPPGFAVRRDAEFQAGGVGIRDTFNMLKDSGPKALYQIDFSFIEPQPWDLTDHVYRTSGLAVMVQKVVYSKRLSTHLGAGVALNEFGFGKRKFHGDTPWAEKLNRSAAVRRAIKEFPRTALKYGNSVVRLPIFAEIAPGSGTDVLTVETLPELTWFGLKARLEPNRFLQLASAIEEGVGDVLAKRSWQFRVTR